MAHRSIITDNLNECYLCHRPAQEIHHCIYGCRHKLADEDGLIVGLCAECHRKVHGKYGYQDSLYLKQVAQEAYEKLYGHDAYMTRYGKNYKKSQA